MAASKTKNIVGNVKRTFLRMSSPRAFGGKTRQFDSVVSSSVPAMIARADAAAEAVSVLLSRNNISSLALENRIRIYSEALELLTEAKNNLTDAVRFAKTDRQNIDFDAYLTALDIILRLLKSIVAMTDVENTSDKNQEILASMGRDSIELMRDIEDAYSDFESAAYHLAVTALDKGMRAVAVYAETQKRQFSKNDLEKYAKAHDAFQKRYSQIIAEYAE